MYMGGKPTRALPLFGPVAQAYLRERGLYSYLRPSILLERDLNPNLVGAAVLAEIVYLNQRKIS